MKTVLSREIVEAAINQLILENKIPSVRNIRAITGGSYQLILRYRKEIGGIPVDNNTAILNLLVSKIDNLDRTIQNLSSQIQDLSKLASKKKKKLSLSTCRFISSWFFYFWFRCGCFQFRDFFT